MQRPTSTDPRPGAGAGRPPVWSGSLTDRLADRIPAPRRHAAAIAIKTFHTAAFLAIGTLVAVVAWDGIRSRPGRRTAFAAAVALGESAVFVSNNRVCPLTPLAEQLGAGSGTVTDIFLPDRVSRSIPTVAGSALVVGLVLNVRAWRREGCATG